MSRRRLALLLILLPLALTACGTMPSGSSSSTQGASPMTLEQTKQAIAGDWISLAPEIRPSALKNADGTLKPFYLKREFKTLSDDRFELIVVNSADPYGKVPMTKILIRGHIHWRGDHPIAPGAQKVDFVADEAYEVTPLVRGFADVLNQVSAQGYAKWEVGQAQSIFGKDFVPFGLTAGKDFMEYDLVYVAHGLLFWGATKRGRPRI